VGTDLEADIPIILCDARRRDSANGVLIAVVEQALHIACHQPPPVPPGGAGEAQRAVFR
jgi:hypothetical protein